MKNLNSPVISVKAVGKSYGSFLVLKNIDFSLQRGEKVGLVGPNGIGKTTLFKILAGLIEHDQGKVLVSKGTDVGYIPQEFSGYDDITVSQFINTVIKDDSASDETLVFPLLEKLDLSQSMLSRKIGELSGGEKTKVALVRILLVKQDLLLLDEPTNNLDNPALVLLEDFIKKSDKTFIIISHDRRFLDSTVGRIFEIDGKRRDLLVYDGNFTEYMDERRARIDREWKEYENKTRKEKNFKRSVEEKVSWIKILEKTRMDNRKINPKEKEKPDDAILRDKEAKMGRKARVMRDRLERFSADNEEIKKPEVFLPLNVDFEVEKRGGDKVFRLESVFKRLPKHDLGPIDLDVRYGDRVLITGPNGGGKTTLLKILMDVLKADAGTIEAGSGLKIGYLPQGDMFSPDSTVREEFLRHARVEEGLGRRTLHRFKLEAADVGKRIKDLSSGERSRLILAILMAKKVNCLILDEPSNHLDLEVLESLERALKAFTGTLIVVSHDRYFIDQVGLTKKLLLQNGGLKDIAYK